MKRQTRAKRAALATLVAAAGWGSGGGVALAADSITSAITGGKVSANVRLRYEMVDEDGFSDEAEALTLRTRLGYETKTFHGFSAMVEFEDIHTIGGLDEYAPESAGFPVVADPKETEVNRAYLRYRGISKLDLGYGRQRLIYDNARFIGNVGWRQDEQTFDAFTASYTGLPDVALNYAYLDKVEGIMEVFDADVDDHLFNVSYSGFTWGKFVGYAYLLDHSEETDATVNPGLRFDQNDTVGLRFEGAWALPTEKPIKLLYALEYASQEFESQAGVERDADYLFAEGGVSYGLPSVAITAKLAHEVLGSDDGLYGFQTPYATKHAFNGWNDKFLVTPNVGLRDTFATLGLVFPAHAINAMVMYHEFEADEGSGDFGSEVDIQLFKTFGPHYTVGIKYGLYDGEDLPYRDTDKLWVWGEIAF